jgi:hypothetical protein
MPPKIQATRSSFATETRPQFSPPTIKSAAAAKIELLQVVHA